MRSRNKHLDPDATSAATLPPRKRSDAVSRFPRAATKAAEHTFSEENGNEHQSKMVSARSSNHSSRRVSRTSLQALPGIPTPLHRHRHASVAAAFRGGRLLLRRPAVTLECGGLTPLCSRHFTAKVSANVAVASHHFLEFRTTERSTTWAY